MLSTQPMSEAALSVATLAEKAPPIALPAGTGTLSQDSEWFLVKHEDQWHELRLHDYPDIFSITGLYEKIVYDILKCRSPGVIRGELIEALKSAGQDPAKLTVLDLGAGNGIVSEELSKAGIGTSGEGGFFGADLLPEAAVAAERDRPGLYDDYIVGDITDLPKAEESKIEVVNPEVLICVAALGFGDIPPEAFIAAFERVASDGWVALCIKDEFVGQKDRSGFSELIDEMIEAGTIEIVRQKKYIHRIAMSGKPLEYVAYIARKRGEID